MIAVINSGIGNIRSVLNALDALGAEAVATRDPNELQLAKAIVLPGVGSFGDGMSQLRQLGLDDALKQQILKNEKPFLGICLGMQLLATKGVENGTWDGLNIIPGIVDKLNPKSEWETLRIPHIGWNDVTPTPSTPMFDDQDPSNAYYFVHSNVFRTTTPEAISSTCFYGEDFISSLAKDNIWATQFHPEKSHTKGLMLLKRWLEWSRKC